METRCFSTQAEALNYAAEAEAEGRYPVVEQQDVSLRTSTLLVTIEHYWSVEVYDHQEWNEPHPLTVDF